MPWYVASFWLLAGLLAWAAWRWAEWPERFVALVNLLAPIATRTVRSPLAIRYHSVEGPILLIDLVSLSIILFVALRADRWWPIVASAMLSVSMLAHLARAVYPPFGASGYSAAGLVTYGVPISLAIGIANTARRRAKRTL